MAVAGCRVDPAASSSAVPPAAAPSSATEVDQGTAHSDEKLLPGAPGALPATDGDRRHRLGSADGVVPDGVSVFDDGYPAVANLDPDLLTALRRAATDAGDGGVELDVSSGWRSASYQKVLFRQALAKYGSEEEAARWVSRPGTSVHQIGNAVDIGPSGAAAWLSRHGSAYGLCQIYANEGWHFELRPDAVDHGCPRMYADPTHDPRMQ